MQKRKPKGESVELLLSQIGRSIMEVPRTQVRRIHLWKGKFFREILSLHTTLGKVNYEETKQLFLNNVLIEALDDGTPAYYNSNILGRYMKKDYGDF